jgi:hypothetical protein
MAVTCVALGLNVSGKVTGRGTVFPSRDRSAQRSQDFIQQVSEYFFSARFLECEDRHKNLPRITRIAPKVLHATRLPLQFLISWFPD